MSAEVLSPAKPVGRPPMFSQELAAAVCERMANGESLRQICRDDPMPSYATVMKWAATIPEFAANYARARTDLLAYWEDEQIDIADDGSNDWIDREVKGGRVIRTLDEEHVRRSQLRIDTRKWLMSHLLPRKYGDRLHTELSGPNGGPIQTQHTDDLTDAQLAAIASTGRAAPAEPEAGES
jgi:hypothetical protein